MSDNKLGHVAGADLRVLLRAIFLHCHKLSFVERHAKFRSKRIVSSTHVRR